MAYKLTPETTKRITQAIRVGATYKKAAQFGGITYQTFREWVKRGEKAKRGKHKEFYDALQMAEAVAYVGWLAKIEEAGNRGDWRAVAWKLERRYSEEWGKKVQADITHTIDWKIELRVLYDEGNVTRDDIKEEFGDVMAKEFFAFVDA